MRADSAKSTPLLPMTPTGMPYRCPNPHTRVSPYLVQVQVKVQVQVQVQVQEQEQVQVQHLPREPTLSLNLRKLECLSSPTAMVLHLLFFLCMSEVILLGRLILLRQVSRNLRKI